MHLYEDVTAKYCKYCIIYGLISRSECNLATEDAKRVNETQVLLKELPYFDLKRNLNLYHGQFNNSFQSELPTNRSLERLNGFLRFGLIQIKHKS